MPVPTDVTVTRQVLAEPDATRATDWATLADGTPLVTAARRGKGLIGSVPRHRRYALVEFAAFGHLRRHAQAHRRLGREQARLRRPKAPKAVRYTKRLRRATRSMASVPLFLRRRRRGRCRPISLAVPQPIIRRASMVRRRAMWRSTRSRPPIGSSRSISVRSPMRTTNLSHDRAARSARTGFPRRTGAVPAG